MADFRPPLTFLLYNTWYIVFIAVCVTIRGDYSAVCLLQSLARGRLQSVYGETQLILGTPRSAKGVGLALSTSSTFLAIAVPSK